MVKKRGGKTAAVAPQRPKNNIANWRTFRGYDKQGELADKCGVARETINRLESGKMAYRQKWLEAIATVLNCTPLELIEVNPYDEPTIFQIYGRLSQRQRTKALTFVRSLLDP